ncbi:MAG: FkbM family methyltransferase [Gemmatimonadaceae bacterium]
MIRRLKDISRWHIEKHMLSLVIRPEAPGVNAVQVADALLPRDMILPDWICYCAGVGEDIRIERFLAETRKAQVWAFDPTPRSIAYMARSTHDRTHLHFMPVGLWSENTTLRFNAPENPEHVSHSIVEDLGGADSFEALCRSIPSVMTELGHDRIDLLKMNIEGAEDVVMSAAVDAGVFPRVLSLTFEGGDALLKARRWNARLHDEGYTCLGRIDWFVTYVRGTGASA